MDKCTINIGTGGCGKQFRSNSELFPDGAQIINPQFVLSGGLYDLLNDMASVRDREIKRKCEIKERIL